MENTVNKRRQLQLRKLRIRTRVRGTTERPRLTVTVSNQHVSAQVIDDNAQMTLISASSVGQKNVPKTLTARAVWVGEQLGAKAQKAQISKVVFDRNGRRYHGRIKALADAARAQGMEF